MVMQYGSVPLGIAADNGHTETVQRLLELGANVNCQEKVLTLLPVIHAVSFSQEPVLYDQLIICALYNFVHRLEIQHYTICSRE